MGVLIKSERSLSKGVVKFNIDEHEWSEIERQLVPLYESWGYFIGSTVDGKLDAIYSSAIYDRIKDCTEVRQETKDFFRECFKMDGVYYTFGD